MSSTVQITLDNTREIQLAEIIERDPTLPRAPSEAVKQFLFRAMEQALGVKKE